MRLEIIACIATSLSSLYHLIVLALHVGTILVAHGVHLSLPSLKSLAPGGSGDSVVAFALCALLPSLQALALRFKTDIKSQLYVESVGRLSRSVESTCLRFVYVYF